MQTYEIWFKVSGLKFKVSMLITLVRSLLMLFFNNRASFCRKLKRKILSFFDPIDDSNVVLFVKLARQPNISIGIAKIQTFRIEELLIKNTIWSSMQLFF